MHWVSELQVVGQLEAAPLHTYCPHAGSAVPAGEFLHVPTLPARVQVSHELPHALLQHTPSTQLPLPHWLVAEHTEPLACLGTHAPALQ